MTWIYLSPHFDDAVLSCGGLLWEQAQQGNPVEVWTICAGEPGPGPLSNFAMSLHQRWQTGLEAIPLRRQEDQVACSLVGAQTRRFSLPDCIYRHVPGQPDLHLYTTEEHLFGPLDPRERSLALDLAHELGRQIAGVGLQANPPGLSSLSSLSPEVHVVCPLALGGHVDHRLVRQAAELTGWTLDYYADYPYVLNTSFPLPTEQGWHSTRWRVTAGGLAAWQAAVAAYHSQISTFWPDLAALRAAIEQYGMPGVKLWHKTA
jgi:LmbE family N-acetylglucosaminyl deacetylase